MCKVKVKVCGLKRLEDIEYINEFLPDFAGFVFTVSKRRVMVEHAIELTRAMNKSIKKVGVFVNEEKESILQILNAVDLDVIQLHGDETCDYIKELRTWISDIRKNIKIWKSVRVKNEKSLESIRVFDVDAVLLDSFDPGVYGGSGSTFDWELLSSFKAGKRIILAGGLNASNVREAVLKINPYTVDVSSGVEIGGVKDRGKIKEFIKVVRNINSK